MEPLEINKVEIRNLQREDYDQLASSFTRVYADGSDVFWTPKQIDKLIRIFPEGQIVVVVDGKIVGCALSIIVNYDDVKNDHTYAQVTGNETFDTHTRKGNILYGIEVFIHPDYRGLRLARRMYEYRKELCEKLNLKAIMFGEKEYRKYAPYLLTAFFFIFISNLLGIVPFFPGGANVTGNIAVTMVLALCTFVAVNLFGNRHYWKEILWPDVPLFLKFPIPIMQTIELFGLIANSLTDQVS